GAGERGEGKTFRKSKKDPPFEMDRVLHGKAAASSRWGVEQRRIRRFDRPREEPINRCEAEVRDFFAVADDDVWAVGPRGVILHWNGSAWSGAPRTAAQTTRHPHTRVER